MATQEAIIWCLTNMKVSWIMGKVTKKLRLSYYCVTCKVTHAAKNILCGKKWMKNFAVTQNRVNFALAKRQNSGEGLLKAVRHLAP